jgi:hypothetical protein
MVRNQLLLALVALVTCATVGVAAPARAAPSIQLTVTCTMNQQRDGTCPSPGVGASVGDGGVDVSAGWEEVSDGNDGGSSGGDDPGDGTGSDYEAGGGGFDAGTGGYELPDGVSWVPGAVGLDRGDASPPGLGLEPRRQTEPAPDAAPAPGQPAVPACEPQTPCDPALIVRVRDLVSIPAAPPVQGMEPDGWLVVGIPTNFFAAARTHISSGSLLGAPAEVRFTPVGYMWDYGDGSTGTSSSGGASWAALGLAEFSETSTSHVFESSGTLTIGLSVSYAAEYRFAGGEWRSVEGLLQVPGEPMTAIADRAGTVLVAEACAANPTGPGCP